MNAKVIPIRAFDPTLTILLHRARQQRQKIDQLFADAAYWNAANPDQEPIEVDADGRLRATAEMLDALLKFNGGTR